MKTGKEFFSGVLTFSHAFFFMILHFLWAIYIIHILHKVLELNEIYIHQAHFLYDEGFFFFLRKLIRFSFSFK
jgi:hypothetical protein